MVMYIMNMLTMLKLERGICGLGDDDDDKNDDDDADHANEKATQPHLGTGCPGMQGDRIISSEHQI